VLMDKVTFVVIKDQLGALGTVDTEVRHCFFQTQIRVTQTSTVEHKLCLSLAVSSLSYILTNPALS
jgi:hypothetical protein